jgi:hypothetical protein
LVGPIGHTLKAIEPRAVVGGYGQDQGCTKPHCGKNPTLLKCDKIYIIIHRKKNHGRKGHPDHKATELATKL